MKTICFLKKKKVTNLKKGIKRKILLDVLICSKRRRNNACSSNCSSGMFFCHFRIYIRNTSVHCIIYTLCFVSFSFIKDVYIEIRGKKEFWWWLKKQSYILDNFGKSNSVQKQFCFNTVFITKDINVEVESLFLRICLFLQLLLYLIS